MVDLLDPRSASVPPLESGDHLSRAEFERRYEAMPEPCRAELIEGIAYVASPARYTQHGEPHGLVVTWLGLYASRTPGVGFATEATVRLDMENEPQPDVLLRVESERGGQSRVGPDDYLEGAPELVVEVAASSVSYDLHEKLRAYRRNGVQEYIVWRVLDEEIDWFVLADGAYARAATDGDGRFRSQRFPGLWLDAGALVRRDFAGVRRAVDDGTRTEDHAAFVASLAR